MKQEVRVRFAPSPTGLLHLGSVRIALFNYIFSKQKKGTFILRIEDTDLTRNFDPGAQIILQDLAWLTLNFDEGPCKGGPYEPYFQSERSSIYAEKLNILLQKNRVYRCFCTQEELEKKRNRQLALKKPPRYDQTCLFLTQEAINTNLKEQKPFVWRFRITEAQPISITDLARGTIDFDFKNFSDFPVTRQDGSFTFLFANAIDDIVMNISHVFRGEDHISNTPCQIALYMAFDAKIPLFWHMPTICSVEGKKLSKRDFGFSLQDLKREGFLPEAICNYLAIIGASFKDEIMSLEQLISAIDFTQLHSTSAIKYDLEKLTWVNHQWLLRYTPEQLTEYALPFLISVYPQAAQLDPIILQNLLSMVQPELKTLKNVSTLLAFYFEEPTITKTDLLTYDTDNIFQPLTNIINNALTTIDDPHTFFTTIKEACHQEKIPLKSAFRIIRVLLTGLPSGPGIKELLELLGGQEAKKRFLRITQAIG